MDNNKKAGFVQKMRKPKKLSSIKRKNYAAGSLVSGVSNGASVGAGIGSIIPGVGTVIGGAVGAIGGFISSLFGGGPQLPNITDPVSGQQITDANGNVVATQTALNNYAATLQGQNGAQNQQAVIQSLGQIATGNGPNPAKAMLAEATGQNVAAQSSLMAGQRGATSNVGLIAREAAQQGASTEQQAVAQNAVVQSNQSLNALNSQGQIAGQQVQETQNALQAAGNQALNTQGQVLNAQSNYNSAIAGGQNNVNTTNAAIQNTNQPLIQGAIGGLGTAQVVNNSPTPSVTNPSGTPQGAPGNSPPPRPEYKGGKIEGPHKSHVANFLMAKGGKVPGKVDAMVSPGEIYLSPDHVKAVQHGANPFKLSRRIPGKASVKGDSIKNDTIPTTLEEGGVVLPRHVVNSMSPDKAKLFVLKSLAKKKVQHG